MTYDDPHNYRRRQEVRHGGITDEELPHASLKKKSKRWCHGKVGVEHDFSWQDQGYWRHEVCTQCGKFGRYKFLA